MSQLALNVGLNDQASFENYFSQPAREAVDALREISAGAGDYRLLFLHGVSGCGKSHLLQAACGRATGLGRKSASVPLADWGRYSAAVVPELEHFDLLCLDDLDAIAGNMEWEQALFHLSDRMKASNRMLVAAANRRPDECGFQMPELSSRMNNGLVLGLKPLSDPDKARVLKQRAASRGLELPDAVVDYLMRKFSGNMNKLFHALERLDRASLARQKRIALAWVRDLDLD